MNLVEQVNVVLTEQWDPIGMMEIAPEHAYSEYSSYALSVAGMIDRGESAEVIAEYLYIVRTEHMGMKAQTYSDTASSEMFAARQLVSLKSVDQ